MTKQTTYKLNRTSSGEADTLWIHITEGKLVITIPYPVKNNRDIDKILKRYKL